MSDEVPAGSVEALSEAVARVRAERDGLREAMRNRAVIEQAKGALAERLGISPEAAFTRLVDQSTRSNVKVAELAARVMAEKLPEPPEVAEVPVAQSPPPESGPAPVHEPGATDSAALRAQLRLLSARIETADSFDDIARALAAATAGWPAPAGVAVLLLEADGALRLAGAAGLSPVARSRWQRVPPIDEVPVVSAVHHRAPVYLDDARAAGRLQVASPVPCHTLVALPLIRNDSVTGVVEFDWSTPPGMDKPTRDHLFTIAGPVADRCAALANPAPPVTEPGAEQETWDVTSLPLFVAALTEPAAVLVPRFGEDDRIVDFHAECLSPAARRLLAGEHLDSGSANLLTVLPDAGSRVLLPALSDVVRTGEPRHLPHVYVDPDRQGTGYGYHLEIHASRLWDRVLMTWRVAAEAELLHEQFLETEARYGLGAFRWEQGTGETRWSPGMYRLTGRDRRRGPMGLDAVTGLIDPADRDTVRDRLHQARHADRPVTTTVRGTGKLAGHSFELTAAPLLDEAGDRIGLSGTCRDVTDAAQSSQRAEHNRIAAAAQRGRLSDANHTIGNIVAPMSIQSGVDGIEVKGLATGPGDQVLHCWYDTFHVPGASIVLIVGEVLTAEPAALLRIRHAAAAYAVAGMEPGELLATLNTLCRTVEPDRTATVSVARIDPSTGKLSWAAAGQVAPIFFRPDRSATIHPGALGLPIGAADGIAFQHNDAALADGEQLVLYTQSLVTGPDTNLSRTFEALLDAAEATTPDAALDRLRHHVPAVTDTELCLLMARREPGSV